MSIDLKRSHSSERLGRLLATGTTLPADAEGKLVCSTLESGVEKATLVAAPAGTEKVIGFVMTGDSQPGQTSLVEDVVVPAASPYTLSLRQQNLVSGQVRVVRVATNVALTVDTTFAGTPGAGVVKVDLVGGQLKFNSADAGVEMLVTYQYSLTLDQSKQIFGERFVNNRGLHASFGQVEVQGGIGELYTDQFDASVAYDSSPALKLGPNGIITTGGAGPTLNARVVAVPSVDQPMLGIAFRFTA